jgi:4-alpha-glucanotransferase
MMFQRSAGILLHPTSLPGEHGIGDLGRTAHEFVDLLADAGQHVWQVLPLGPVGAGNSPYDSRSSFAGNSLLISLNDLVDDGLLEPVALSRSPRFPDDRVDFASVDRWKQRMLRVAFDRFNDGRSAALRNEFETFKEIEGDWLRDFALYQALHAAHDGSPWYQWDEPFRLRRSESLREAQHEHEQEIAYHSFVQFLFQRQWAELKRYASGRGIAIMGDIPIYVARDSAEVWANQGQFLIDERGRPEVVAGVPPDMFSSTGQLWGNPCYDWDTMATDGYSWWLSRFRRTLELADIVRVDHFRGFAAGWQVRYGSETAIHGEWIPGPGRDLFEAVGKELGELPIVVEDLGVITPDVVELRESLGYPGMKVLQFAFDGDPDNLYLPHNYTANAMVYTGTHDNDTTAGWFASADEDTRARSRRYARATSERFNWDFVQLAWGSVATLACAPVQDILGLGSEARMNIPGRARGNWTWRLRNLTGLRRRARALRDITELYGRSNPAKPTR